MTAREHDDRSVTPQPKLSAELRAGHTGKAEIEQRDVRASSLEESECLARVGGKNNGVPESRQSGLQGRSVGGVVVNYKYGSSVADHQRPWERGASVSDTAGAVLANLMFSEAAISISTKHRASGGTFSQRSIATTGLLLVIFALARTGRSATAPAAVGSYIGATYFFTSSTSFANPAIAIGRMFSNSFAGIASSSAPSYIVAEIVGAAIAFGVIRLLYPHVTTAQAENVVLPHADGAVRLDGNGSTSPEKQVGANGR